MVGIRRTTPPRRLGPRGWRGRPSQPGPRRGYGLAADVALALTLLAVLGAAVALGIDRGETVSRAGRAVVADGDTLTVGGERIRLRGIDAPEHGQLCTADGVSYACGRKATEALRALVADRHVTCTGGEHDRYGRLLAVCTAGGTELNAALVAAGWAVAFGGYAREEAEARTAARGLWAGEFETPQAWRRAHGRQDEVGHDVLDGFLRRLLRYLGVG